MNGNKGKKNTRQILGRVAAEEFIGRSAELERLVQHPGAPGGRGFVATAGSVGWRVGIAASGLR